MFLSAGGATPLLEQEDAAEDGSDLFEMVGDQNHGRAPGLPSNIFDGADEPFAGNEVQPGPGLIENDQARIVDQGPCDEEALLFPL